MSDLAEYKLFYIKLKLCWGNKTIPSSASLIYMYIYIFRNKMNFNFVSLIEIKVAVAALECNTVENAIYIFIVTHFSVK